MRGSHWLSAVVLAVALAMVGCTTSPSTPPAPSPTGQSDGSSDRMDLADVEFWGYQIQAQAAGDNLDLLADSDYELLVIDQTRSLIGEKDYDSAADVAYLKAGLPDRLVVCYWDVGEAESYRWYWEDDWGIGNPEWIVAPDPDGWDENYPVAFWDPEWQDIMFDGLDMIIDDGYDGVYLDWLEIYDFVDVVDIALEEDIDPEEELVVFIERLVERAHERDPGFLFIAQNAAEMGRVPGYLDLFDAIAQEAIWFDGGGDPDQPEQTSDILIDADQTQEYLDDLAVWLDAGIPVFNVEYAIEPEHVEAAYEMSADEGYVPYVTTRPLAELTDTTPPGY